MSRRLRVPGKEWVRGANVEKGLVAPHERLHGIGAFGEVVIDRRVLEAQWTFLLVNSHEITQRPSTAVEFEEIAAFITANIDVCGGEWIVGGASRRASISVGTQRAGIVHAGI